MCSGRFGCKSGLTPCPGRIVFSQSATSWDEEHGAIARTSFFWIEIEGGGDTAYDSEVRGIDGCCRNGIEA